MTRRPVIGITTYGRDERGRYTLPAPYVDAVQRAGGLPMLLAPLPENADAYLQQVDGLILAGGGDIDPKHYGGTVPESLYSVDAERDALELALARTVMQHAHPVLAICRGLQVLNVAHGGSLVTHLPDEVGEQVLHRAPPREPVPHPVEIRPGSRLARITGVTRMSPMSWHHQAVKRIAPGFEAVAHAPDGTVEAAERAAHPWMIAV
ncbi:MAG TPA: gamma-glutamyl-gamma-aminobutyrate hydrolase family protein [Candidatus Binatia bacterium]|nr:gamma-glutamyl-gamma-aminobutyrate hydrolase family protein [Candidatus Binatia bacterium]